MLLTDTWLIRPQFPCPFLLGYLSLVAYEALVSEPEWLGSAQKRVNSISDTSIHQWRKELTEHGSEAFPGSGHQTAIEEENRRLNRELDSVKQERDILKKAIGIFSREKQ